MTHSPFLIPHLTLGLILAAAPPRLVAQVPPVDSANWRSHPAIQQVEALYNALDAAATNGSLSRQQRTVQCRSGVSLQLFRDSSGTVRIYTVRGGGDDSAGEVRYYYDAAGTLRFALEHLNHVDGLRREIRVYYDDSGNRLWLDRRILEGEDRPSGFRLDIRDPVADFLSERC